MTNETTQDVGAPLERQVRPLPEGFVRKGLELAEGALLFGKPFADMTRDELIAAASQGWNAEREQRERHAAESKERADWYVRRARDRYGLRV